MEETDEPRVLHDDKPQRRKLGVKLSDVIIFGVIIAIIVGLSLFIVHRQELKHEVAQARVVADKTVAAMGKQNTALIYSFGDKSFRANHTAAELNSALTFQADEPVTFSQMYGDTKPKVDEQIVANNANGRHVAIIYVYGKLKVPFFVRIDTIQPPHSQKWYLQALSASPDEGKLATGFSSN